MPEPTAIDGVLVQWGDRLFYPGNRIVQEASQPRLAARLIQQRAAAIRARIAATVIRRAPQVMVKVTGGGRGMRAIAAHFRYISKNGRLDIEDDRGETFKGRDDLRGLVEDWRLGGTPIDEIGYRREALNIMLSMPRGVDPLAVQRAAREFAQAELAGHKYIMVLHDHQANPHVHISVRAESRTGKRLNPRKADLQRWRARFAEALRGWGVEAEASSRTFRGQRRQFEPLWRIKARGEARLRNTRPQRDQKGPSMKEGVEGAWQSLAEALSKSAAKEDRDLGRAVERYIASPSGRRVELTIEIHRR